MNKIFVFLMLMVVFGGCSKFNERNAKNPVAADMQQKQSSAKLTGTGLSTLMAIKPVDADIAVDNLTYSDFANTHELNVTIQLNENGSGNLQVSSPWENTVDYESDYRQPFAEACTEMPQNIRFNPAEITYNYNGEDKTVELPEPFIELHAAMTNATEKMNNTQPVKFVDYSDMTTHEIITFFIKKGYEVIENETSLTLTKNMKTLLSDKTIQIISEFNLKTFNLENPCIYNNGKRFMDMAFKESSGPTVELFTKTYSNDRNTSFAIYKQFSK